MKVYDVFPFFNELDLLEIRLNTLNELVDEFIVTEANSTFSGIPKRYYLSDSLSRFKKFSHKITIQQVDSIPIGITPFARDRFQRDQISQILNQKLSDEDILIYGDVDEIPNPSTLHKGINLILKGQTQMIHLAQDVYYCYLNQKEVSGTLLSYTGEYSWVFNRKWLGTNVSRWSYSKKFTPTDLRSPEHKKIGTRLKKGGWHFSYIGSEGSLSVTERVSKKLISAAHQEYNSPEILLDLNKKIEESKDIFSRRKSRYRILHNLDYLPVFILNDLDNYKDLIKYN